MGIAPNDHDVQTVQTDDLRSLSVAADDLSPSLRIVAAIADTIGTDPATMAPLFRTVDTEALDRLLASDTVLEVVFEYQGHAIEVGSDGHVTIDGEDVEVH
ncbi:hypothetical protein L593_05640 [Salinarchaeum sp. Harcht-Bsk1]|uniref:HalOD1 output domain-containing protein n=1 Tax=Salinarchaeum sp. Harcht-Bsk1 TaxID=1333523 RepID=UPI0003424577|nr:HalOD1 output domain-containing protein [Salinarchaeum sp. Harcht-Bsk1]AGN01077.1 hypothetical protein L593_05640 [Salinarchaeum sp. Harcht-Bsk1]